MTHHQTFTWTFSCIKYLSSSSMIPLELHVLTMSCATKGHDTWVIFEIFLFNILSINWSIFPKFSIWNGKMEFQKSRWKIFKNWITVIISFYRMRNFSSFFAISIRLFVVYCRGLQFSFVNAVLESPNQRWNFRLHGVP